MLIGRRHKTKNLSFLDVGVGIATDEVILGMTGNDRLRDFTVIGTAVNLAAALEWSARDGKHVLCDNHTFVDAREIVESSEEPQRFNIGRPNQVVTHWYRVHEITALRIQHGERLQEIKPVVQPARQPHVFASYAHKDLADVEERVVKPLERAGANVSSQPRSWRQASSGAKGSRPRFATRIGWSSSYRRMP